MTDILNDSYDSDLTEAESTELLLMCGHAIAPPLSPAARAVLDAVRVVPILLNDQQERIAIATALRAAALYIDDASDGLEYQDILRQIAAELEQLDD